VATGTAAAILLSALRLTLSACGFGQPGVDPAETEEIARAAVRKLQRRQ
jgi:hypothetical protein